ncbi:MAG: hypothetical protein AAGU11_05325, partial [Syntrophobacteraceae bacterium]
MKEPLWVPSDEWKENANIKRFLHLVNERHRLAIDSYRGLYDWSAGNIPEFWAAVWDFVEIK